MMLSPQSLVSTIRTFAWLEGCVLSLAELSKLKSCLFVSLTNSMVSIFQELHHLRAVAVLMTFIMVVAVLTSIAIVRRILMATSVLKVSMVFK